MVMMAAMTVQAMPNSRAKPPAMENWGMMTNRPMSTNIQPTTPPITDPALLGR